VTRSVPPPRVAVLIPEWRHAEESAACLRSVAGPVADVRPYFRAAEVVARAREGIFEELVAERRRASG